MATQYDKVAVTLSNSTGFGTSFTASYPSGKTGKDYAGGTASKLSSNSSRTLEQARGQFTITHGTTTFTVNILASQHRLNKGETVYVHLDRTEGTYENGVRTGAAEAMAHDPSMKRQETVKIDLGTPDTADVDGIFTAYTGSTPAINGALSSDGIATFDVPRNIVVDSGGADTAVLTFTGTDLYGNVLVESITLNGTTAAVGKKAFKTVTGVTSSGAIANGAFAGPGNALGLPVFLDMAGLIIAEIEDGVAATAGTALAGDLTTPTATTGDVRGTYTPNTTPDGSTKFDLAILSGAPSYKGLTQYAG